MTAEGSTFGGDLFQSPGNQCRSLISTVNAVTFDRLFTGHFRWLIELARVLQRLQGRINPSPRIARELRKHHVLLEVKIAELEVVRAPQARYERGDQYED